MNFRRAQHWQLWRRASLAITLAACWMATVWLSDSGWSGRAKASDFENIGAGSFAAVAFDPHAADETTPLEPDGSEANYSPASDDPQAMYRLPPVEEIAPDDAPLPAMIEPLPALAAPLPSNAFALPPAADQTSEMPSAEVTEGPELTDGSETERNEGLEPAAAAAPEMNAKVGAYHATPYAPTTDVLSRQLLPTVRRAYGLAQHGAVYAAQTEFIQVLRRIAESKDAAEGVDTHSRALAAGLRTLDEADDFAPRGTELEAEMNVAGIVSAHRTPVLRGAVATARPTEAIALYHQYARGQLALAVAGEQAGSMALYGLGKVQNRLAYDADGELQHERKALTMFLAALDAGPGNHLAANEVGVLLARSGDPAAASELFRRAIDVAPNSTSYHNLAVTDRMLGYHEQAAANEQFAWQLAQRDRAAGATSRAKGVQWVAPQELSRVAQPMPIEAEQSRTTAAPERLPQPDGAIETAAKWPQKLVPGIFRR